MVSLLKNFDGHFTEKSVQATCYAYIQLYMYKSFMNEYYEDEEIRIKIVDNYNFVDYIYKMLKDTAKKDISPAMAKICAGAHPDYKGDNVCAYNLALSFV